MLTVKIDWGNADFVNYSVYTCDKYLVCGLDDDTTQLLLDDGTHDIRLGQGCRVYVMNERGSTVDTISIGPPRIPSKTAKATSLWVNPNTGRTEERIY